jgi:hypothetical protein
MKHQFFQGFIPQQEMVQHQGANMTPELRHNEIAMEIYANWEFVKELVERAEAQQEINVVAMEMDWLNFINQNKVDIKSYENNEDFIEKNLKPLVKDEK